MTVNGGFLGDVTIELADGLNCFIGGRGTGKTTALEFLRYGLGLLPDARTDGARRRAVEALVKANLRGGRLSVELQTKNGMSYSTDVAAGQPVQVRNSAGVGVPVALDRDSLFSADVFSQNEIEELAVSPPAQLSLLDRFVEDDVAVIERDLEDLARRLEQSAGDLIRMDREVADLKAKASEAGELAEKLMGLTSADGPDAEAIAAAHAGMTARTNESTVMPKFRDAVAAAARDVNSMRDRFLTTIDAHFTSEIESGANAKLFAKARAAVDTLADVLEASANSVSSAATAAAAELARLEMQLAETHAAEETKFREFLATSEEETERARERARAQERLANATAAANDLKARENERGALLETRKGLLKQVSELRDSRFQLRKKVAQRLTAEVPGIRVTVKQAADLSGFRAVLAKHLKGAGVQRGNVAERLAQEYLPRELAGVAAERDESSLLERLAFDEARARKTLSALSENGGPYAIEAAELRDLPCIELLDGATFKAAPKLSTGQRCTTILPILLLQSARPLLIDQPEDNIDNAFIYSNVVSALKAVKGRRQVIVVTHNPNIPVLGEAERVFVFRSDGEQATLEKSGSVDTCRGEIEAILEGGSEAFKERKRRYGY